MASYLANSIQTKFACKNEQIASLKGEISRLNEVLVEEKKSGIKKDQEISQLKSLLKSRRQNIPIKHCNGKKGGKCYKTKDVPSTVHQKRCIGKKQTLSPQ